MQIQIIGGKPISGSIYINAAKNAVLPILAASLLIDGTIILHDIPKITDIDNMLLILSRMGCHIARKGLTLKIHVRQTLDNLNVSGEIFSKLRGSILISGAIFAKTGKLFFQKSGGCSIGARPIDIHISSFKQIHKKNIFLDFPSVGATENLIIASVIGHKTHIIHNAAKEPEVADLCDFLNACGAKIDGIGTSILTIQGVKTLHGTEYTPIPDRITTGSYMLALIAAGGDITLQNVVPEHNANLIAKLKLIGAKIKIHPHKPPVHLQRTQNSAPRISHSAISISYKKLLHRRPRRINIHTAPYEGFPTDLQSQFAAAAATINGTTTITENLFENRFHYVTELKKLGAKIMQTDGKTITIKGVKSLAASVTPSACPDEIHTVCSGLSLTANDLRGGVALVIAALGANGTTTIINADYIYRGHADIVKDLFGVGANIISIN
ncbi:MAG: UDP-N-acetylglucosamine 1-carboxyvinyltransferase [Christensenellaceae bacterium]|jgi:UDP-N-acetylglucosamine 1-carboxyvinyltransferase|nr:UDP-N-acetylglucosamine 1-carboxyvinyltransferase [Christensenellaceae bacterium]